MDVPPHQDLRRDLGDQLREQTIALDRGQAVQARGEPLAVIRVMVSTRAEDAWAIGRGTMTTVLPNVRSAAASAT